jgi:hypothetical protein
MQRAAAIRASRADLGNAVVVGRSRPGGFEIDEGNA